MGDLRRLEIFKAGQHQDEHGSIDAYSVDDLNQMVQSFDPELSCPLAIGHTDSSSPAYGWAKRLWVEGDRLFCEMGDLASDVQRWLKHKFYNKVSIEVFPPDHLSNPKPGMWHLARICLLGAAPPAIAGGPPIVPFRYAAIMSPLKTYSYATMTPQEQLDDLKAQIAAMELEMGKQEFAAPMDEEEEEDPVLFAAEDEEDPELFADVDMPEDMGDDLMMDMPTEPMANPFIDELMLRAGLDLTTASDSSGVGLDLINEAIAGGEPLPEDQLTAVMDALFSGEMFSADMDEDEMKVKEFAARLSKQEQQLKRFSAFVTAEHKLNQSERAEIERTKIKAFCAQLVTDHKIRPNEADAIAKTIEAADHKVKRTYAAGKGEQTSREVLMQSYSDRVPMVDSSHIDAGGSPSTVSKSRVKAPLNYAAPVDEENLRAAIHRRMEETGETYFAAYTTLSNKNK